MELELDDVYSTTGIDLRIKLWRGGSQASTQNKQQICRQEKRTPFALGTPKYCKYVSCEFDSMLSFASYVIRPPRVFCIQ